MNKLRGHHLNMYMNIPFILKDPNAPWETMRFHPQGPLETTTPNELVSLKTANLRLKNSNHINSSLTDKLFEGT